MYKWHGACVDTVELKRTRERDGAWSDASELSHLRKRRTPSGATRREASEGDVVRCTQTLIVAHDAHAYKHLSSSKTERITFTHSLFSILPIAMFCM